MDDNIVGSFGSFTFKLTVDLFAIRRVIKIERPVFAYGDVIHLIGK